MSNRLSVYINNNKVLDYDKNTRHPGKQRQFIEGMDLDMDEGIEINDEMIHSPNKMQRANYVAMTLLYGLEREDEGMIAATCGYLVNRLPDLKQVRAIDIGDEITMELIFNEIN